MTYTVITKRVGGKTESKDCKTPQAAFALLRKNYKQTDVTYVSIFRGNNLRKEMYKPYGEAHA